MPGPICQPSSRFVQVIPCQQLSHDAPHALHPRRRPRPPRWGRGTPKGISQRLDAAGGFSHHALALAHRLSHTRKSQCRRLHRTPHAREVMGSGQSICATIPGKTHQDSGQRTSAASPARDAADRVPPGRCRPGAAASLADGSRRAARKPGRPELGSARRAWHRRSAARVASGRPGARTMSTLLPAGRSTPPPLETCARKNPINRSVSAAGLPDIYPPPPMPWAVHEAGRMSNKDDK